MGWSTKSADNVHNENNIKGFTGKYRWLSNFGEGEVVYKGILFPHLENAYQAAKCDVDEHMLAFIDMTAGEAKKYGRRVTIRADWNDVKLDIMEDLVRDKFTRNEDLKILLLATGDKYLEETNWWGDKFWGVHNGLGDNHLGKILMKIRNELKGAQ